MSQFSGVWYFISTYFSLESIHFSVPTPLTLVAMYTLIIGKKYGRGKSSEVLSIQYVESQALCELSSSSSFSGYNCHVLPLVNKVDSSTSGIGKLYSGSLGFLVCWKDGSSALCLATMT